MSKTTRERLKKLVTKDIYPPITLTPVLEHEGDFVSLHHIEMEWPEGEGANRYAPINTVARGLRALEDENIKLRELVEDVLHDAMENVCSKSYWCENKDWATCNDESCGSHIYVERARELGIEVE